MSGGQLVVTFLVGAAIAAALGVLLGRRVRVTSDWRLLAIVGGVCFVAGSGVAAVHHGVTAEFLIALALAWFGVLAGGFAGGQVLRVRRQLAPPPEGGPREPTL